MTLPIAVSADLDIADTIRALDDAFRRHDDVRVTQLRLRLGRLLGTARSAHVRARTEAKRVRAAARVEAITEAVGRLATRYPAGT